MNVRKLMDLCGGYEHAIDAINRALDNAGTTGAKHSLINLKRKLNHFYFWG